MVMMRCPILLTAGLAGVLAAAVPHQEHANIRRQITELRESYDFIVAGGGTAGLTVADRLTEAFPDRTVLVVEYGTIQEGRGQYDPPGGPQGADTWSYASLPIPALRNRSAALSVGKVVGGSSVVNGQFFDRGSRFDYDEWAEIGRPEFEREGGEGGGEQWDWEGLKPWFKKSVKLTVVPSQKEAEQLGYTWDEEEAYGEDGPIDATYPPFQWPIQKVAWEGWVQAGVRPRKECAGGDKDGLCWVPTSQDPVTAKRSHAGIGHYQKVKDKRPNFDLLVKHKVTRVVYGNSTDAVPQVEIRSLESGEVKLATAKREVVISAGAVHTPQILQRSGIAHAGFLEKAGIKVVQDLAGVGYNFHDHAGPSISANLNRTILPDPSTVTANRTFGQEALDLYALRPAQGPYTLAMGNSAIYVSLPNITASYGDIIAAVRKQIDDGTASSFLPPGTPEPVIAGYKAQLEILIKGMGNPRQPILESPFMSSPSGVAFLLKPLSRGTILLDPKDHDAEPLIDYRTCSNPVDLEVMASFVPYFRHYFQTDILQEFGAREVQPGERVQTKEQIIDYVRGSVTGSFMHPCCTAAMMPREKGGVVGSDLKVFGVGGLSVADLSIVPIIPGTHTSATAYAIGEKAADILIRRHSK